MVYVKSYILKTGKKEKEEIAGCFFVGNNLIQDNKQILGYG